ncbi:MAG TPA: RecQ family ATP-dependent DNA helicase [Nannocystaceae bacterium]|nr:RecQ family ATP-dependent DNA helicase [Nannocystaceae bacterium]
MPLIETLAAERPLESLAFAMALRFVECCSASTSTIDDADSPREARLRMPPSPALAALPRFSELLVRLLGPLCPDSGCVHRAHCDVHRPRLEEILARNFELRGFRPHQEDIVRAVLDGRTPLAILPTGGGKSLCYQLPAVHGAQRLHGLTVVVSPLQALMADQVRALSTRFPGAATINASLLMQERSEVLAGVRSGRYDIVYLGPEQLRNPGIVRLLANRPPFLWVIDEAHCISQWGHGFRTDYTYLPRAIARLHDVGDGSRRPPLVALFTATATRGVIDDIATQVQQGLGVTPELMDFGGRRDNLAFEVIPVGDGAAKTRELIDLSSAFGEGARLVYCATVRTARDVAEMLRERGIATALYHGKLSPREKKDELERFLSGRVRTVVATSAFGMGIDKPDIRLVVHHDLPGSIEDYVQEAGRAGRDGAPARCVLLFDEDDLETQFFLKSLGRVTARDVRVVFQALRARARHLPKDDDDRVVLWVSPDELFVEEDLGAELDWSADAAAGKLKLVLYHLERDGVLEREENRTRAFGIHLRLPDLAQAEARLPERASPATRRVLRYLYDPERPRQIGILDIAEDCGLSPADAFRELQTLTKLELVGQELAFEASVARGVERSTNDLARRWFDLAREVFALAEDSGDAPHVELRAAAVELGRRLGRSVPPHEVFALLRALRRLAMLRLDKAGPSRYRVRFEPGFLDARDRVRTAERTATAVLEWVDRGLVGRSGRDLRASIDVQQFLDEERQLYQSFTADGVVEACLLLHHLEAWHISDPPVLFDIAMKVRFDPSKTLTDLHARRADEQHAHELSLVHLLREYAVLPANDRQRYVDDYFRLSRDELLTKWFRGRVRSLSRPVTPIAEARLLAGLTDAQREAVTADDAAVLVVAGPGSGKTHTVVRRIVYMVRARQVRPHEILVLVFNRGAATELRTRLDAELGKRARMIAVRTFHSFALRLTGDDLRDEKADSEQRLQAAMVRAAALLRGDEEALTVVDRAAAEELRRRIVGPVRHVLVDEYQDLDPDQYALLEALVGLERRMGARSGDKGDRTERSVYVVGDDDQALYGFRRASVEFLRRFEDEFAARRIGLVESFRSPVRIVDAAARFIARNADRMKTGAGEQIRAAPGMPEGGDRALRRFIYADPEQLAAHVVYAIEQTIGGCDEGSAPSIAVLARHWSALDAIRHELESRGIRFLLHHRDFHRPAHRRWPAARILQELWARRQAVIVEPAVDVIRVLVARFGRGLDEPPVADLLAAAEDIDHERVASAVTFEPARAATNERVSSWAGSKALERGARSSRAQENLSLWSTSEPASLPNESPLPEARTSSSSEPRLATITAGELADALLLASREAAARGDVVVETKVRVHLSTFHGAKGLEFDRVYVMPCRGASGEGAEEERRAYYVAMTRARQELVLATFGERLELAAEVGCAELDLRAHASRQRAPQAAYLDCTPADVRLASRELARAQGAISKLREGDPLDLDASGRRVRLSSCGTMVAELSIAGQAEFEKRIARVAASAGPVHARVHEVYRHLMREDGDVRDSTLVVLPTIVAVG